MKASLQDISIIWIQTPPVRPVKQKLWSLGGLVGRWVGWWVGGSVGWLAGWLLVPNVVSVVQTMSWQDNHWKPVEDMVIRVHSMPHARVRLFSMTFCTQHLVLAGTLHTDFLFHSVYVLMSRINIRRILTNDPVSLLLILLYHSSSIDHIFPLFIYFFFFFFFKANPLQQGRSPLVESRNRNLLFFVHSPAADTERILFLMLNSCTSMICKVWDRVPSPHQVVPLVVPCPAQMVGLPQAVQ